MDNHTPVSDIRAKCRDVAMRMLKKDKNASQSEIRAESQRQCPEANYYDVKLSVQWARKKLGIVARRRATEAKRDAVAEQSGVEVREHETPSATQLNIAGCKKLATDLIKDAWESAGKRVGKDQRGSFAIRYSRAWLQTPSATAMWCELIDIDPDQLAEMSRIQHGVPKFTKDEIAKHRAGELTHAVAYIGYNGSTKW